MIKLSGLDLIKSVVNFLFCLHKFVAKRKQTERNGTHNAQFNTETTERNRSRSKAQTSKTPKDIKTLTNILNGIKSKNLDEEYKVGWIYYFNYLFLTFFLGFKLFISRSGRQKLFTSQQSGLILIDDTFMQAIPRGELHPCNAGKRQENLSKNRYTTIFPCKWE